MEISSGTLVARFVTTTRGSGISQRKSGFIFVGNHEMGGTWPMEVEREKRKEKIARAKSMCEIHRGHQWSICTLCAINRHIWNSCGMYVHARVCLRHSSLQ